MNKVKPNVRWSLFLLYDNQTLLLHHLLPTDEKVRHFIQFNRSNTSHVTTRSRYFLNSTVTTQPTAEFLDKFLHYKTVASMPGKVRDPSRSGVLREARDQAIICENSVMR